MSIKYSAISSAVFVLSLATRTSSPVKRLPISATYYLFTIDSGQLHCGAPNATFFARDLKTDLVALRCNDIRPEESIQSWIKSNAYPYNSMGAYCDASDVDNVCIVKFNKQDGRTATILEFICGNQIQ